MLHYVGLLSLSEEKVVVRIFNKNPTVPQWGNFIRFWGSKEHTLCYQNTFSKIFLCCTGKWKTENNPN